MSRLEMQEEVTEKYLNSSLVTHFKVVVDGVELEDKYELRKFDSSKHPELKFPHIWSRYTDKEIFYLAFWDEEGDKYYAIYSGQEMTENFNDGSWKVVSARFNLK